MAENITESCNESKLKYNQAWYVIRPPRKGLDKYALCEEYDRLSDFFMQDLSGCFMLDGGHEDADSCIKVSHYDNSTLILFYDYYSENNPREGLWVKIMSSESIGGVIDKICSQSPLLTRSKITPDGKEYQSSIEAKVQ